MLLSVREPARLGCHHDGRNLARERQHTGQYSVGMTDRDGLGRRLARYRKRLGFDSTRVLAARTGGRVSEAVLQNIESGRKPDLSVAQLLEISRALGISP